MREGAEKTVEALNGFLRGEISAVETYRQAIEKLGSPVGAQLEDCRRSHERRVDKLRDQVARLGGEPAKDSGAWGAFAKAVEGTAKLFGNTAALKALKEGEEHGLKDYEDALHDETLSAIVQSAIRGLISRQRSHIQTLDRLIAAQ